MKRLVVVAALALALSPCFAASDVSGEADWVSLIWQNDLFTGKDGGGYWIIRRWEQLSVGVVPGKGCLPVFQSRMPGQLQHIIRGVRDSVHWYCPGSCSPRGKKSPMLCRNIGPGPHVYNNRGVNHYKSLANSNIPPGRLGHFASGISSMVQVGWIASAGRLFLKPMGTMNMGWPHQLL